MKMMERNMKTLYFIYLLCKADSEKAENSENSKNLHDDCVREYIFSEIRPNCSIYFQIPRLSI